MRRLLIRRLQLHQVAVQSKGVSNLQVVLKEAQVLRAHQARSQAQAGFQAAVRRAHQARNRFQALRRVQ